LVLQLNKKFIIASMGALFTSLYADTDVLEGINDWSVSGNLKMGYVNYDYGNPPPSSGIINKGHTDSRGFYTIPKVSLLTPKYAGFSAKVTVAGATDFGINDPAYESRNWVFSPSDLESYIILQELFVNYTDAQHNLTIGRYELETPLLEPDDYYMLADTYETISYINSSINSVDLYAGYVARMAGVWDSGANGTEFHSMSETSFVDQRDKDNADDSGLIYGAIEYKDDKNKAKVWEYYVVHLYNIFLAQYDFSDSVGGLSYNMALQFTNYKEVGRLASNNYTNIDYSIYALKFDGAFKNGFEFATGASKFSNGEGIGSTLSAWGGFPTFTYGYIFNWFETGDLRNARLYKAELAYDLSKIGLNNSWIGYRYTYYDLDSDYSTTVSGDPQSSMKLNGLRFKYNASGNGLYFIANYEHRVLSNEPNAYGYRLIGGYKF